jgi:alkanesulfonate monooxygenase SsuD/methylene tetrahydromethanopterin reductase-like flavin-dependent oxidoreductase (luciferase family)
MGPNRAKPLTGTPDEIADVIRGFAAAGASHIQMYLLPNTADTIRAFAPVLQALGRA